MEKENAATHRHKLNLEIMLEWLPNKKHRSDKNKPLSSCLWLPVSGRAVSGTENCSKESYEHIR